MIQPSKRQKSFRNHREQRAESHENCSPDRYMKRELQAKKLLKFQSSYLVMFRAADADTHLQDMRRLFLNKKLPRLCYRSYPLSLFCNVRIRITNQICYWYSGQLFSWAVKLSASVPLPTDSLVTCLKRKQLKNFDLTEREKGNIKEHIMKMLYEASVINPFFCLLLKGWQQVSHALKLVKSPFFSANLISNVRLQT